MKRRDVFAFTASIAMGSAGGCAAAQPSSPGSPKAVVLAFYKLALEDFRPREAFERFASPNFVDYSPDVPGGGREEATRFLEGLIREMPRGKWTIVRTVAEGDLVFLHVRFVPGPGQPPTAIAEIFRVHGGKLVEHWDVLRHAPEKPINPHPMV